MSRLSLAPLAVAAAVAAVSVGCLPSLALDGAGDGSVTSPTGHDAGAPAADLTPATPPDMAIDLVALFNATVAPILAGADGRSGSCGGCHDKMGGIGPGFLEPHPDILTTMLAYPGLIGDAPETSRIYVKGAHEGPALTATEKPLVANWINAYYANKAKPTDAAVVKPAIKPFAPTMGANTVDLAVLDPSLAGQSITFTARMVGTSLQLSAITINTAPGIGLHVVHPLWVTWDAKMTPTPDPVDSFSNLDQTVFAADAKPMGPGTLFLPGFSLGEQVNVVFSTLEAKQTAVADGGGTLAGCKSVTSFVSKAKPGLQASCVGCHGGNNATATSAFSLVATNSDATDCLNALGEVNVTTPAMSRLFSYPDPSKLGNGHPFHFPDTATHTTFMNDVGMWIANEK